MDPSKVNNKVPTMKDLTADNITENTIRVNSQGSDPRLTYVFERLVSHLHDFARETRISTKEWMAAIHFLTAVGQKCTADRQVGLPPSSSVLCLLTQDYRLGIYSSL